MNKVETNKVETNKLETNKVETNKVEMNKLDEYILTQFNNEKQKYKLTDLKASLNWDFRYICYKFNYFMRYIPLPKIIQNNLYEAVFVEFRILPHIEFLIRNAIFKLGSNWSFTIVCGLDNREYIETVKNNINADIKIIKLKYNNLSQQEYSNLLTTKQFWNMIYGEKILIYQEDSLVFHNNISPFIMYDYIGAPFAKYKNDTPNGVGNGGFSLRTKNKMLEVIKNHKLEDLIMNSSTHDFMKMANLKYPPEDVYFAKNMQEYNIGDVADWDTAHKFSSEQVFNQHSFGGHKFWISNDKWQIFLKNLFNYKKYNPKSDLNKYLKYKKLPINYNKTQLIKNSFDIDIKLFCNINNLKYINDKIALDYINNISIDGFIYHSKQLTNIFKDLQIYNFLNNIYTLHNNNIQPIQNFVNEQLYNSSFDYLSGLLITQKYDTLNDNYDTLLLVFLGNEELSINLLNKLIQYKKINKEFNIAFCINNEIEDKKKLKKIIKHYFDFYAIYYSKEFGTDITPTLLMYNDIIKKHKAKHILKFHTKSISNLYNDLTDYLLKTPLTSIIRNKNPNCNCVGPPDSYISLTEDLFNNKLKTQFNDKINTNGFFVGGTIFYAETVVFDKVLDFIKNNNYRSYLLNNLYENNTINQSNSPIHFLERLFGTITLKS